MAATRSIELEIVILLYIMLVKAYSDFAVEGAPCFLQAEIVALQGSIADVSAFKRKIVPSVLYAEYVSEILWHNWSGTI